MSPELLLGAFASIDIPELNGATAHSGLGVHARAADIWAMGVTLYCSTVGHLPFQSGNILDLNELIVSQP
jgi:serine/threonine protein kinase